MKNDLSNMNSLLEYGGRVFYPSCSFQYFAQFNPIHVNWQYIIRLPIALFPGGQYRWHIHLKNVKKKR